jgi:hypothetical protein
MSSTTSYTIQAESAEGVTSDIDTRSKKGAAIELAEQYLAENEGVIVRVITNAGNVVETLGEALDETPAEEVVVSNRTKPWSRTVEAGFDAPEVEGFTLAYTRNRIATGVYRANDKSGWLVLDTRDGSRTEVENTKLAREITNELSAKHLTETKAARDAAQVEAKRVRDEAKAAKAEAKRLADEAKAAEKAAKEAAKAEKAAADEAAKLAADAEVEQNETEEV